MYMNIKFSNLFSEILSEDAIDSIDFEGDWNKNTGHGWDKASRGILTSPAGIQKLKKKWSNLDIPVYVYFVKKPGIGHYSEIGLVTPEEVKKYLGIDVAPNPEGVTILYINNRGDARVPTTPWTLAHRFGHAIRKESIFQQYIVKNLERKIREILKDYYNYTSSSQSLFIGPNAKDRRIITHLLNSLGTFKSAREGKIIRPAEFIYELVAQYIITGEIQFNTTLPDILPYQTVFKNKIGPINIAAHNKDAKIELGYILENFAAEMSYYIEAVMGTLYGKIFIM